MPLVKTGAAPNSRQSRVHEPRRTSSCPFGRGEIIVAHVSVLTQQSGAAGEGKVSPPGGAPSDALNERGKFQVSRLFFLLMTPARLKYRLK